MLVPNCILICAPVMTEKYVVSLIMKGHNAAPTEIGVLRKEGLYHPEK